jgi:hypothetical protein
MPVDYNILARVPSVGSRIVSGMEAGREAAIRNQLLQRQQMQFEQSQQDRAMQMQDRQRQMQQAQQQEAIFQQAADLIRKSGLDPDDPEVLQQFTAAAVQSRNPQLISLAGQMTERAQKRAQERAYRTEYEQMFGGPQGAAPSAMPGAAPMAAPPPAPRLETTIIDEGRARPEAVKPPVLGAQPSPVTPPASVTTQPLSTGQPRMNALAPAAAPVNAMTAPADPYAAQRAQAMEQAMSRNPYIAARGKLMLQEFPKLPAETRANEPADIQGYRLAQQQGFTGTFTDWKQSVRPQTTVNLPAQPKAEQEARGKFLVEGYKTISDAARLAAKTLPALDTQQKILDKGFKTGFGTDAKKAAASVLSALGVPEATEFATNAQTFLAATQQAVLQRQLEQKGPQTEADANRITQTGAQLGNTSEANQFIIDVARAQLKRDIEQRNFYDAWWKKNGTYDGAEDAWFTGQGGKSLFDRPELKKYAAPTAAPATAPAAAQASAGAGPYSDPDKERRYQEWKRRQGMK